MIIDILTLFPKMFEGIINSSIIKRAIEKQVITINIHDFRQYSEKKNWQVDDYSYGGGAGMIIGVQPIVDCLRSIPNFSEAKKIITTPCGLPYSQEKAISYANEKHLIIVCGHYEGIDNRITHYIDEEVSIGDFILTGGEIAALAIVDSVVRLIPQVLGNEESIEVESFDNDLLEFPQYTRPVDFEGHVVPEVLLSGNHENIRQWRRFKSLENTFKNRPDLLAKAKLTKEDKKFLEMIEKNEDFKVNN
ncbi:MAG TPA: tRNA (guanosine(37)-N1)-methyltransferase TrmD [Bacilli bacterium]|jgi:tRNA (guanine37-N1)-methyltransferase|nr:tRNA (guanosine(37)-N1)-methyltransferase TrmD [Bacilli bacterium]NLT01759.1 tRNA (guanosine(37)-N1)-methyltransferase TrmD [Acholeplasmataceae bacterium]HNZ77272.1 tRNA (guanosine(37)-N1)-methyltransferase TrmD [Bacilli bacterium]HOD60615.1 tRNA (guanosine(37)-N1)-methyltransferase TrmD [Bacilli bacterium]HOE07153.1 tRNA (guanosine(37)-N1)-methyltransferase TrmD [Bacilli bacterium]